MGTSEIELFNEFKELYTFNIKAFFLRAFYIIHGTSSEFLDNWHIDLILEYLKAVESGEIKRLLINMPPRYLKSFCFSVFFPSWLLAKNPTKKIILCSYSKHISLKHNQEVRDIINSNWYQAFFEKTKILKGQNKKEKFLTTARGSCFGTSPNSSLTGDGADYLILDDPQTPIQASGKKSRDKIIQWFSETFSSRLNDKKNGVIIVVMQRLHKNDLSGYLLKKEGWNHIKIPAISDSNKTIQFKNFQYTTKEGELLQVEREDKKEINQAKNSLGTNAFLAQYQQSPVNSTNSLIKAEWILEYEELPEKYTVFQSWDTAITKNETSDYSACITIALSDNSFYIIDIFRKKLEYNELKKESIRLFDTFKPSSILIESKASGQILIQEASLKTFLPIIAYQPKNDKLSRLLQIIGLFESGKILVPKTALWKIDFLEEITSFPNSKHDDQVDALTQFINWHQSKNTLNDWNIRYLS